MFDVKLPEDDLKNIETRRSLAELYVNVHFLYLRICWCLLIQMYFVAFTEGCHVFNRSAENDHIS
jgi:hypothetical protein